MIDLIKKLYTQRQTGIAATLHINGIRALLTHNAKQASITVDFAMLDFDDLTGSAFVPRDSMPGITVMGASCPPDASTTIGVSSARYLDHKIIQLAYQLGACDMSRYYKADRVEWFFKPSWGSRMLSNGLRLPDNTIASDGLRHDMSGLKLFPAPLPNIDDLRAQGFDNQQHIYEFCKSKPLQRIEATI